MESKFSPKPKQEEIFGFKENLLDQFDNVSYNVTLFMVSEANAASGTIFNQDERIIIAKSGVTAGVGIEDLKIKTVHGVGGKSRTAVTTKLSFVLKEAYNATLIDKIYLSSLELGISNYMKVPYFIEIKFNARDVENSESINYGVGQSSISSFVWVFPIIVTGMEASVTSAGSEYEVSAAPYYMLAQTDQYGTIDKAMSITASTVGEALSNVQEYLNERQTEKLSTTNHQVDKYTIDIDDSLYGLKITDQGKQDVQSPLTDAFSLINGEQVADSSKKIIQISAGTSIITAIDKIISSSVDYQTAIKKSIIPEDNRPDNNYESTMKKLHRVVTDSKILTYDTGRGDYARAFTFKVLPYDKGTLQCSPLETTSNSSASKYREYKRRRLLQKHYRYIFSGTNDQILNVDLKFNFAWFANIPRQGGMFTDFVQSNSGRKFKKPIREFIELKKRISTFINTIPPVSFQNTASVEKDYALLKNNIAASELDQESQEILQSFLDKGKSSRVPESNYSSLGSVDTGPTASINRSPISKFSSDATIDTAFKNYKSLGTINRIIPLTYLETDATSDILDSVEGPDSGGRQYVNSLFTQAFAGGSGDLVNLEIEVKGDPFWLPKPKRAPSRSSVFDILGDKLSDFQPNDMSADGTISENFILFTLRTPKEYGDQGEIVFSTNENVYSGVYGVYEVEHSFSSGKFTQVLRCYRDPLIDYKDIEDIQ